MSDTNTHQYRAGIRQQLLTTVSAVALIASAYGMSVAHAVDSDSPPLWIELDGQFAQQETGQDVYLPPFMLVSPFDGASHAGMEHASPIIWDKGAKVAFQPDGGDWIFALAIRYGKNARNGTFGQVTTHPIITYGRPIYSANQSFDIQSSESHVIVDFQVGKDVGLGRFGNSGSSVISAGMRIAQFDSRSHVGIQSQPTNVFKVHPHNVFYASFAENRRFNGIGPSLSWDASANIAGISQHSGISLDWGVNGAVLFGRQKVNGQQQTAENNLRFRSVHAYVTRSSIYHRSTPLSRSRQTTVSNLGGFAGVSWRYPNAKVSFGYRADFFFGAIDGGIDSAHRENVGFYGPFASVSVGIGG